MFEQEWHRAVCQAHGYALQEVQQHEEEEVALVLLGQLEEALGRPFVFLAQLGHIVIERKVGVAHEGCSLARWRIAVKGRMFAPMFQHGAVHGRGICISVLLLLQ